MVFQPLIHELVVGRNAAGVSTAKAHDAGSPAVANTPYTLLGRTHHTLGNWVASDIDVLVVGSGEQAVENCQQLVTKGARVCVVSMAHGRVEFGGESLHRSRTRGRADLHDPLRTHPDAVADLDGRPLVSIDDRRRPDSNDHLVDGIGHAHEEEPPSYSGIALSSQEEGSSVTVSDCVSTRPTVLECSLL